MKVNTAARIVSQPQTRALIVLETVGGWVKLSDVAELAGIARTWVSGMVAKSTEGNPHLSLAEMGLARVRRVGRSPQARITAACFAEMRYRLHTGAPPHAYRSAARGGAAASKLVTRAGSRSSAVHARP